MILHIGLPRTGTTTLQKFLFSDDSLFAPPRGADQSISRFHLMAGIGRPLPDSLADIAGAKARLVEIRKAAGKDKIVLISQERITSLGNTLSTQRLYAERLGLVDPDARIIITFRRQQGLIKSRFTQFKIRKIWAALGMIDPRQNPAEGKSKNETRKIMRVFFVPDFYEWSELGIENQHSCWFSMMNYFDLYNIYAEVLGPENVKVLFFEDLVNNKDYFARQLSEFIGINQERVVQAISKTTNTSPKDMGIWKRVKDNIKKPGEGINPGYAIRHLLGLNKIIDENNQKLLDLVRTGYGLQNRKLADLLGEDLSQRGYLMDLNQ